MTFDDEGRPPIGKPLAGTYLYILDEELEPVGVGVTGEIYLGGAGLGRGYLNRPELTAEAFLPDPFAPDSSGGGGRLYRTGDLGRWRSDGTVEYGGRVDTQVKVRGYRIELGEIEAVLRGIEGVGEAAVIIRGTGSDKQLIGYLTMETDAEEKR